MIFNCKEDGVAPEEFLALVKAGNTVQVMTAIGWIQFQKKMV